MPSQARSPREEERRLNLRTLVIASSASAVAAIVVSRFWTSGTPIAAAITPVIVTLVSEMLHRPTEKIAERFTVERDALGREAIRPARTEAGRSAGAAEPPRAGAERPAGAPAPPRAETARPTRAAEQPRTGEVRVYRPDKRGPIPWKPVLATAAAAFLIAAAVLTLPELIAGQSFGKSDRGTTIFGGGSKKDKGDSGGSSESQPQDTQPSQPDRTTPGQAPKEGTPKTAPSPAPDQTTPQAPSQTAPQQPAPKPLDPGQSQPTP